MNQTLRVLFVCEGNMCRSPMAQATLHHLAKQKGLTWEVSSAGTMREINGRPFHPWAMEVCGENGIELDGTSRSATTEILRDADLVVAMDARNVNFLFEVDPNETFLPKLRLLGEFTGREELKIPDPIGKSKDTFRETFQLIRAGCEGIVREVLAKGGAPLASDVLKLLEIRPNSTVGKQIEEWCMDLHPKGTKYLWDGGCLPEPAPAYDLIIARDLLETVLPARAPSVLQHLKKCLLPEGMLLISAPNKKRQAGRFSAREIEELLLPVFPKCEMWGGDFERGFWSRILHSSDWLARYSRKRGEKLVFSQRLRDKADFVIGACSNKT